MQTYTFIQDKIGDKVITFYKRTFLPLTRKVRHIFDLTAESTAKK